MNDQHKALLHTAGESVTWLHEPRSGYGYTIPVDAVVVKRGPKRVLIEAVNKAGETVQRWVSPERLRERRTLTNGAEQ